MATNFKDFNLKLLSEGGIVQYFSNFLSETTANNLFETLKNNTPWYQNNDIHRLIAWYADDPNMIYGIKEKSLHWTPDLLDIKNQIEIYTGNNYNSVLINYYRNGNDYIDFHADDTKELGTNPTIAVVSLGSKRQLILKQYRASKGNKISNNEIKYDLDNGSLLVMSGTTQHYWKHSIKKTNYHVMPSINLIFRKFIK
jgi:alkylated DNA repair dioxygenase AlkB